MTSAPAHWAAAMHQIDDTRALLAQLRGILQTLAPADHARVLPDLHPSSVGQHVRHVLDHYQALVGATQGYVDYNQRQRDLPLEADVALAVQAVERLSDALDDLRDGPVQVRVDACQEEQAAEWVSSSMARELAFADSHAVHHFAVMRFLLQAMGQALPADFGVAASTLAYRLRQQGAAAGRPESAAVSSAR